MTDQHQLDDPPESPKNRVKLNVDVGPLDELIPLVHDPSGARSHFAHDYYIPASRRTICVASFSTTYPSFFRAYSALHNVVCRGPALIRLCSANSRTWGATLEQRFQGQRCLGTSASAGN